MLVTAVQSTRSASTGERFTSRTSPSMSPERGFLRLWQQRKQSLCVGSLLRQEIHGIASNHTTTLPRKPKQSSSIGETSRGDCLNSHLQGNPITPGFSKAIRQAFSTDENRPMHVARFRISIKTGIGDLALVQTHPPGSALDLLTKNQGHIASGVLQQMLARNTGFGANQQTLHQVNERTASHLRRGCAS